MKKQKFLALVLLGGVCIGGISLFDLNIIGVAYASHHFMRDMISAVETGVPTLFYVFFIKGVNPDCVEMTEKIDNDITCNL